MDLQPFLHDLLAAVRAPTQAWSAADGQVRRAGAQGVYHGDVRVLAEAVVTVGGVEPESGGFAKVVTVDLRELSGLRDLDRENHLGTFGAGTRGPAVEAALAPHGFTLGHYPQSHQEATIGGYVATRSAGQASTGSAYDVSRRRCARPISSKNTWVRVVRAYASGLVARRTRDQARYRRVRVVCTTSSANASSPAHSSAAVRTRSARWALVNATNSAERSLSRTVLLSPV